MKKKTFIDETSFNGYSCNMMIYLGIWKRKEGKKKLM